MGGARVDQPPPPPSSPLPPPPPGRIPVSQLHTLPLSSPPSSNEFSPISPFSPLNLTCPLSSGSPSLLSLLPPRLTLYLSRSIPSQLHLKGNGLISIALLLFLFNHQTPPSPSLPSPSLPGLASSKTVASIHRPQPASLLFSLHPPPLATPTILPGGGKRMAIGKAHLLLNLRARPPPLGSCSTAFSFSPPFFPCQYLRPLPPPLLGLAGSIYH